MSRGFDGFEVDDFRDPGSDSGRDVGRGSSSNWSAQTRLYYIHREEDRADQLDREGGSSHAQSARRWLVRNASKQFSLNAHEPSTRTETKIIPCGIQRFIRFRKLASSASQPGRT
jgi:hypothetical protein